MVPGPLRRPPCDVVPQSRQHRLEVERGRKRNVEVDEAVPVGVVREPTRDELCGFVESCVAPGSTVRTDGWQSYRTLKNRGYTYERVRQQRSSKDPCELLPGVHRLASLLKRWLLGTHHGAVTRAHLPYYLDEFTFRFNRRKSKARGKLFFRLVEQALAIEPAPYKTLIKPNHYMLGSLE